jgi:hypothetical protein
LSTVGVLLAVGDAAVLGTATCEGEPTGAEGADGDAVTGPDVEPGEDLAGFGVGALPGLPGALGEAPTGTIFPLGLLDSPLLCPLIPNAPTTITTAQPAPISRMDQVPVPSLMR